MYGAGDVRIGDVPDPVIHAPADAIVGVVRAAICGSDLHPYRSMLAMDQGLEMGQEFPGIIEDTGAEGSDLVRPGSGLEDKLPRLPIGQSAVGSLLAPLPE